jgi:hypothetical protein
MKGFALMVAALFQLAALGNAYAHGDDKPKHGGIMGRGDDTVTVELVMEKGVMALYVEDHNTGVPIPADKLQGASVSVLGPGRPLQQSKLIPAGANKLTAGGLTPRVGDRVSARFILPNGMETMSIFNFREPAARR